ncbi:MAG: TRAP transporter large permease subunit [Rhizobiaceae bacterium]|nr:TRAP transporter large permease subunit [Rhizobiaceae bacterium]
MMSPEFVIALFCLVFFAGLLSGFPIFLVLAGVGTLFAIAGDLFGFLGFGSDIRLLDLTVRRIFSLMSNITLVAVPMFVLMGIVLDKSKIAGDLLDSIAKIFRRVPAGLAVSVIIVGTILAAATGVASASVILLGTLALPAMAKLKYDQGFAAATVCVAGGLGSVIPPSVMLVIMADQMVVSVSDLFIGSVFPGLILAGLYLLFCLFVGTFLPSKAPSPVLDEGEVVTWVEIWKLLATMVPPLLLIIAVLGSILFGFASPTEASGVGAFGAVVLALVRGRLNKKSFIDSCEATARITAFIFGILIGATALSVVMRGLGGDDVIRDFVLGFGFGNQGLVILLLVVVFFLGFLLDWIEISLILLPIAVPILDAAGVDKVWFTVLFAVVLQTSFITPPVGFSLFYVRSLLPDSVHTNVIYRGVIPFVGLQVIAIILIFYYPATVSWLIEAQG